VSLYRTGGWGKGYCSYPLYLELAKRSDLFQRRSGARRREKVRFTPPGGRPQFTQREFVSGNYFSVQGVAPGWAGYSPKTTTACRRAIPGRTEL